MENKMDRSMLLSSSVSKSATPNFACNDESVETVTANNNIVDGLLVPVGGVPPRNGLLVVSPSIRNNENNDTRGQIRTVVKNNRLIFLPLVIMLWLSLAVITEGNNNASSSSSGVLSSLELLDDLWSRTNNITRVGSVDVLKLEDDDDRDSFGENNNSEIAICHFVVLYGFTQFGNIELYDGSYESAAALALAAQHLNTGNGSIVEEVKGLNERCNIRFTVEFQDSQKKQRPAVDAVIQMTDRKPGERLPCGIFGADRSAVSMPTSIVSGLRGFPQISSISTSSDLNDEKQYPLFGRTIPSDDLTAIPLIRHLHEDLNVNHLAVLHTDDPYGNSYSTGIQLTAQRIAPIMRIRNVAIPYGVTPDQVIRIVHELKATQYRYFMVITVSGEAVATFLEEAYKQGIAGTGKHTWIFAEAFGITNKGPYPKDSALAKAIRGTGLISASAGITGFKRYDQLTDAIASIKNPADLDYLTLKFREYIFPYKNNNTTKKEEMPFWNPNFANSPTIKGVFTYDAAILMGLAACNAKKEGSDDYFDGKLHFDHMKSTHFDGASGKIVLDNITGTRTAESAFFTLHNFVVDDTKENDDDDSVVYYKAVESRLFRNGGWETITDFVYNDGTRNIPDDLPPLVVNPNHISSGLRITGLLMCAIVIALSFGFAGWTISKRESHVIKASQPIFLLLICAGSAILGTSIVTLSSDQGLVKNEQTSQIACIIRPWLISIGFVIIFSALYAKTYRIYKILNNPNFKRIKVTSTDVAKPMIALVAANVLVLILLTALALPSWTTKNISFDTFGRVTETLSYCRHSKDPMPYFVTLAVMDLGTLALSAYYAYLSRNISTEFAESDSIFKALTLILMVCLMGIPIVSISSENVDAHYFVFSGIIVTICCAVLLLIFIPKIRNRHATRRSHRRFSSTSMEFGIGSMMITNNVLERKELADENQKLLKENERLKKLLVQKSTTNSADVSDEEVEETITIINENRSNSILGETTDTEVQN